MIIKPIFSRLGLEEREDLKIDIVNGIENIIGFEEIFEPGNEVDCLILDIDGLHYNEAENFVIDEYITLAIKYDSHPFFVRSSSDKKIEKLYNKLTDIGYRLDDTYEEGNEFYLKIWG